MTKTNYSSMTFIFLILYFLAMVLLFFYFPLRNYPYLVPLLFLFSPFLHIYRLARAFNRLGFARNKGVMLWVKKFIRYVLEKEYWTLRYRRPYTYIASLGKWVVEIAIVLGCVKLSQKLKKWYKKRVTGNTPEQVAQNSGHLSLANLISTHGLENNKSF